MFAWDQIFNCNPCSPNWLDQDTLSCRGTSQLAIIRCFKQEKNVCCDLCCVCVCVRCCSERDHTPHLTKLQRQIPGVCHCKQHHKIVLCMLLQLKLNRSQFTHWLCRQLTSSCKGKTPKLPADRKPGPPFTVLDEQQAQLQKMMAGMKVSSTDTDKGSSGGEGGREGGF